MNSAGMSSRRSSRETHQNAVLTISAGRGHARQYPQGTLTAGEPQVSPSRDATLPRCNRSCPMFMTFDDDNQTKTYDAPPPKDDLIAFVKPFVKP